MLNRIPVIGRFTCLVLLVGVLSVTACRAPRVSMMSERAYSAKPPDAAIECFVGKLERPYEPIAIVDSERYLLQEHGSEDISDSARAHNEDQKRRMLEDLKKLARDLGGDAVHNIRMLAVEVKGLVLDENVPIPGAVRPGISYRYFLRGEVVHLVEEVGLPPTATTRGGEIEEGATVEPGSAPESQSAPETAEPEGEASARQGVIETDSE